MSYYCSECDVNWWPHQTDHGRCPMCGEDTAPGQDIVSDDADILSRIARDEAAQCDAYARFELYFDERGQDHAA
jgi:hypothetical protein